MRVLLWSVNFWPNLGGLERITGELALAVRAAGWEVEVVAPDEPGRPAADVFEGIPVHRFPFHDHSLYLDLERVVALKCRLDQLKRRLRPHLVHVSGCGGSSLLFHHMTRRSGEPTLMTLHGIIPERDGPRESLAEKALREAQWVVCCSNWTRREACRRIPELEQHSSVVANSLPLRTRAPRGPYTEKQRNLLFVGRLSMEKGAHVAVEAMRLLPGWTLRIAGTGMEETSLCHQAQGLPVEFLGRLEPDQVLEEMSRARAVLVSSLTEGFGLVALEAASTGTPVIASSVGGLSEVIEADSTGLLVPPGCAAELAGAVQRLEKERGLADRLGLQAQRRVVSRFRWDVFVESYLGLYQRLAAAGAASGA